MKEVLNYIQPHYQVGGSVRDELLGLVPKDYDYTTPLLPDEIEQKIREAGKRPFITGKRFGTVAFKGDKGLVEITTFRSESYLPGSRKPVVEFAKTIEADLSRRDFTINAMAKRGERLIDPFGGEEDLKNGVLRAVGNPTIRFKEDPLRLLRLARFAAEFAFSIEEKTMKAAQKTAHCILAVSKERWMQELDKLLVGDCVAYGLDILLKTGLMKFILPEIAVMEGFDQKSPHHRFDLYKHTQMTVTNLHSTDPVLRWAALLHDVGKPAAQTFKTSGQANYIHHDTIGAEMVYGIAKRLKWSEERRKRVTELVKNHMQDDSPLRMADKSAH